MGTSLAKQGLVLRGSRCGEAATRARKIERDGAVAPGRPKPYLTLLEAFLDGLDDGVLLFGGHLVVAGQAQAAGEDVGAVVLALACNIGVGAGASVAASGDECVAHVHGLHVHGFPNGAAFGIHGGDAFQDFRGAALAFFVHVQGFGFAAHLLAHGVLVDNQATEPEVRFAVSGVVGVHGHGQALQAFLVAHVDSLFLGDVFVEVGHLAADYAGDHVAHAVVVADFFVLVPRGGFAALGAPLADFFGVFLAVGKEHAAAGAGDDLVAVEADGAVVAKVAGLLALVACAEAFGSVFDDEGVVFLADGADFVNPGRGSVEVHEYHQAHVRVNFESLFEGDRVHVPGLVFGVDEHGLAVFVSDGVHGGVKRHVATEHFVSAERTFARLGHAVESFASKFCAEMEGCGAGRECDGVLAADLLGGNPFDLVDVRADGAHPVGFVSLGDVLDFVAVHSRAREPDLFLETHHGFPQPR